MATLSVICGFSGWRQSTYNVKRVKRLFRKAQQLKRSTSKDPKKKKQREQLIKDAHQEYIDLASDFLKRAGKSLAEKNVNTPVVVLLAIEIQGYILHADRQIDQIQRRVIKGEKIPHEEKVFSVFEDYTEWINKGKAGVPVELGLRVCVLEDQYGFILHHRVMEHETDDKVAVAMIEEAKNIFPNLFSCSFDKGFHSPENQKVLQEHLDFVVLPKKGKLSQKDREREYSEEFLKEKHQHSAVESAINALEVHGLDRCLDHGINGFKRYVAYAVLGRNIQQVGVKIRAIKIAEEEKEKALKQAA